MDSRNRVNARLVLLGAAALLLVRCESTDLLAPTDGQLTVTALPQTAVVDAAGGRARSTIRAEVTDAGRIPVESAAVTFSPAAGTLIDNTCISGECSLEAEACTTDADCPLPSTTTRTEKTNSKGVAEVVLVVTAGDGGTVAVTATSGALSDSANVGNPLDVDNDPPEAEIAALQSSPVLSGGPVDFDGSSSSDPDGDAITCYQWTISSSIPIENRTGCVPQPAPPAPSDDHECVIQGAGDTLITLNYFEEQRLTVTLAVSDGAPADVDCFRSGPILGSPPLSALTDSVSNFVVCNNDPPVAEAGDYPNPFPLVSGTVTVVLDGSGSSDPENLGDNSGLTFSWTCGNNTSAPNGETTTCNYTVAGTYTVQLTVTDQGNPGPNGEPSCGKQDTDTTLIEVTN